MEVTVQTQVPWNAEPADRTAPGAACTHCGTPCAESAVASGGRVFCCGGCRTVYELLTENGLGHFYDLGPQAGIRAPASASGNPFAYLDDPLVQQGLLDYADSKCNRVTFRIPAIHCVACVWLLENLFRLKEGIGRSQVNFPRRELSVTFEPERVSLSALVALLHSLGYAPDLNLASLERKSENAVPRRLWLRLGVAGFSFGNIMLFSLPSYLGLRAGEDGRLAVFFGLLSILLAVPVLAFAASDYFHAAWVTVRRRILTIDLPIAVGLVALFGQSVWEIGSGRGEGYLDSLTGLVFFLLIGKAFQHRTYERLVFDRDYKSFFPLSVWRRRSTGDEMVSISRLAVGDRLVLRHGELIPADGRLVEGVGLVDYSFVTGESAPVERQRGDTVYAGGVQQGGLIEVEILKPVSHSYLTSLWADEAFAKTRGESLDTLTNRFSRRFTASVVAIALGAAAYWAIVAPARAVTAFTSVLIVACPCALALAAPFALGTAQRLLGRRRIFLKNSHVIEALAKVDTVVFDKTGTLTAPGASAVQYQGGPLTGAETLAVRALLRASTHPYAARIVAWGPDTPVLPGVRDFEEVPGRGVAGEVTGRRFVAGSAAWLESRGIGVSAGDQPSRAAVHVAIDGRYRGRYELGSPLRPEAETLIRTLDAEYELALSSGDHGQDSERFRRLFGPRAAVHFHQSPMNKLGFVRELQGQGRTVAMVGDGLNDAGALRQSDVGVAVVERMGAFSPASDVILEAAAVGELTALLRLARASVRVVWLSFLLSSLYNVVGLSIAASGRLSPLICAILMPLSSLSVVLFATAATRRAARRCGLGEAAVGAPAGTGPREVAV